MKGKTQAKRNKSRRKNKDDDEVIEINDASLKQSIKLDKLKMKSENIENNSSEDTTNTNKRKNNKKKKANEDLIEIMDVEAPDDVTDEKTNTRQKRTTKDKETKKDNKDKKKQKGKSCGKILCKEKSTLNKKKKTKTEAKINLDEESESEIQVMTEAKVGTLRPRNKSKSPIKKSANNKRNSSINKTSIKVVKKNKKKEKEVQQIELSENDESIKEKEKEKEKEAKKPKDKKKKNNIGLDSSSCSNKKKKMSENSPIKDTKSIIKKRKNEELKERTFLGKKRKADKSFVTPKKQSVNSEKQTNKKSTEGQKHKTPSITENDERPKTPIKNNKNLDLSNLKLEKNEKNEKKENISQKIDIFDKLVAKYGIEEVLDSLFKPKIDQSSILDSSFKELKDICPNKMLNFVLCKTMFSYFNSRMKEIENIIQNQKRSVSETKSSHKDNSNKKDNISKEKLPSKDSIIKSNSFLPLKKKEKKKELEDSLIQIEIEDIDNMENGSKNEEKNCSIKNKSEFWNVNAEEKKPEKKDTSIGSHYNKSAGGNIYKYQAYRLDGKGNAVFKCFDDKCNGMGTYNLETMKFEIIKEHSLKFSQHEFIANNDKDIDNVLKELALKNKSNAQVFKENGERTVKYY